MNEQEEMELPVKTKKPRLNSEVDDKKDFDCVAAESHNFKLLPPVGEGYRQVSSPGLGDF